MGFDPNLFEILDSYQVNDWIRLDLYTYNSGPAKVRFVGTGQKGKEYPLKSVPLSCAGLVAGGLRHLAENFKISGKPRG